ncbi:hypothetical protein G6F57_023355 [Rhizopus arrhizus]|nr:hypothetical protein G6F57_023355 [Rhizopus arrhizus]
MQRQQARRGIERARGRRIDISLKQIDTPGRRSKRRLRQRQHLRGRIHADETPSRVGVSEYFQLQAASGAQHQDAAIIRDGFCQQQRRHLLKRKKARDLLDGAFGVTGDGLGIGE